MVSPLWKILLTDISRLVLEGIPPENLTEYLASLISEDDLSPYDNTTIRAHLTPRCPELDQLLPQICKAIIKDVRGVLMRLKIIPPPATTISSYACGKPREARRKWLKQNLVAAGDMNRPPTPAFSAAIVAQYAAERR